MGFIDLSKYQTKKRVSKIALCGKCKLNKGCVSPDMAPTGLGEKDILFVAEAPGKQEDKRGEQLIGQSGKTVRRVLRKKGIDLDVDCRKINAVNCRPPKNRNPTVKEIECCRPNVWNEITKRKPKVIVLLGYFSVESVIGNYWKKELGPIAKWRGWRIPDQNLKAWICPTYHPSYLNYEKSPALEKIFTEDIQNAIRMVDYRFPDYGDEQERVKIITDTDKILKELDHIQKSQPPLMTYDYETTGLKPHAKGHEIVCASISIAPDSALAFPMKSNKVKAKFRKILGDNVIKKIASNLKFEESWNRFKLKRKSHGWIWDTMIAAHVLDNRRGITSLKFQAYVRYGIANYDSHLSPYLEAGEEEGANTFNDIHKADQDEVLIYCGLDSMFEHRLALDQMKEMGIIDPEWYARTGRGPSQTDTIHEEPKPPRPRKVKRK